MLSLLRLPGEIQQATREGKTGLSQGCLFLDSRSAMTEMFYYIFRIGI